MKRLILIIFLILISGCVAQYKDISGSGYSHLLDTEYELIQEMFITGVNLPPGYGKDINLYIISSIYPTWKGPENISRYALPVGTSIIVKSIRQCTNCFEKKIQAIVEVPSYFKVAPVPIEIDLEYIQPKYLKKLK